jgi:glutaconate CoA-transferase subunit A
MELSEAVAQYVRPGSTVYIGNFSGQLFCVGHELLRAGLTDLHIVMSSGGLLLDQLIGGGVVSRATFAHCWSPIGPAPAWNLRRWAEAGDLDGSIQELPLGCLITALTSAAWDVAFLPVSDLRETGFATDGWSGGQIDRIESHLGTQQVVQALQPDVAFVYVDLADDQGNGLIRGPLGETLAAAQAGREVVVVAEEIVSRERIRAEMAQLPGIVASALVEWPRAVWPDSAVGRYPRDVAAYEEFTTNARDPECFERWVAALRAGHR